MMQYLLAVALVGAGLGLGQSAEIAPLLPCAEAASPAKTPVFGSLQLCIPMPAGAASLNPYNVTQVAITANATGNGATTAWSGFYLQNYTRTLEGGYEHLLPQGAPQAAARFTPTSTGTFLVTLRLAIPALGVDVSTSVTVQATPPAPAPSPGSPQHGFTRPAGNGQTFVNDDGSDLFLVGENLAWVQQATPTFTMGAYLGNLSAAGANYARLWLTDGWDPLFVEPVVGKYSQEALWRLDWVVAAAGAAGVRLMLTFESFNLFCDAPSPMPCFWDSSPYNVVNGGPLHSPQAFFADPAAQALFRQRLAYLVARYAHSPTVLQWELFNEVDLSSGYTVQGVGQAWTHATAAFVQGLDPHTHMITTSFSSDAPANDVAFASPYIAHSTTHTYGTHNAQDQFDNCAWWADTKAAAVQGKPTYVSETGIPAGQFSGEADPTGISLEAGLWSGVFSSGAGTAMVWWWDSWVAPYHLYSRFTPTATFVSSVQWAARSWTSHAPSAAPASLRGAPGALNVWTRTGSPLHADATPIALVYVYNVGCTWAAANASLPCPHTAPGASIGTALVQGVPDTVGSGCAWPQSTPTSVQWVSTATGMGVGDAVTGACKPHASCPCCAQCTLPEAPGFSRDVVAVIHPQ